MSARPNPYCDLSIPDVAPTQGEVKLRRWLVSAHRARQKASDRLFSADDRDVSRGRMTSLRSALTTACEEWDRACAHARREGLEELITEVTGGRP